MIKNIETMTAGEFLRNQVKKGMTPTCPIRSGEGPYPIRAKDTSKTEPVPLNRVE